MCKCAQPKMSAPKSYFKYRLYERSFVVYCINGSLDGPPMSAARCVFEDKAVSIWSVQSLLSPAFASALHEKGYRETTRPSQLDAQMAKLCIAEEN